jgi:hypothetical protein
MMEYAMFMVMVIVTMSFAWLWLIEQTKRREALRKENGDRAAMKSWRGAKAYWAG